MKTADDFKIGDLVSYEGEEFIVKGFIVEGVCGNELWIVPDRVVKGIDLFYPNDLELIERKEAYNAPNKPVELRFNSTLSITIPSGTKLLEGVFCDDNGERYEVSVRMV